MAKTTYIAPGNGVIGPTGLEIRSLLNNTFPAKEYYVPEVFNWGNITAYANTILVITYDHNLANANITMPINCTIKGAGGRLLNIGNLIGNNSRILNPDNLQMFNTVVEFTGTWVNTEITPQAFGAICTANPDVLEAQGATSSSPAIQKVFDSPFLPIFPNGYYYITAPTIITRQVVANFGTPVNEMIDEYSSFVYRNDHVRFYTDKNINFWDYRKHAIYLIGGVMDVRKCLTWNSDIYHIDSNYPIWGGEASGNAVGALATVRTNGNMGTYFRWSTANSFKYGYIAGFKISTHTINIARGVIVDDPKTALAGTNTWCNGFTVYSTFDGVKQALNITDGGLGKIRCNVQTRDILDISEIDIWQIIVNSAGNTLDLFVWDVSTNPYNGYYRTHPNRTILINAPNNILEGASRTASIYYGNTSYRGQPVTPVTHDSAINILNVGTSGKYFNSEMHNMFAILSKMGASSIGAYDGSTVDFDTEMRAANDIGLSVATNITISNPTDLFNALPTCYLSFTTGANLLTDFVEINLPFSVKQLTTLHLMLNEDNCYFNRIQIILKKENSTYLIFNEYTTGEAKYRNKWYEYALNNGFFTNILIRFIGASNASGLIRLRDIAIKSANYNQNFVKKIDSPFATAEMRLTQTGTSAPTFGTRGKPLINTTGKTITLGYTSTGKYTIYCSGAMPKNDIDVSDETITLPSGSTIRVYWFNTNQLNIETKDSGGSFANGILNEQYFGWNRYF